MTKALTVLSFACLILVVFVVVTAVSYTRKQSGCEDCWKHLENAANTAPAPTDLGMPAIPPAAG